MRSRNREGCPARSVKTKPEAEGRDFSSRDNDADTLRVVLRIHKFMSSTHNLSSPGMVSSFRLLHAGSLASAGL